MKAEKEQTVMNKTLTYLENYREMERYIKEAVSADQIIHANEKSSVAEISKFLQVPVKK